MCRITGIDKTELKLYLSTSWPLQKALVRIDPYAETKQYLDGNVTIDLKVSRIRGLVSSRTVHLFCVVGAKSTTITESKMEKRTIYFTKKQSGKKIAPLLGQSSAVSILRFMVTLSFNDKQTALTWNTCFRLLGNFLRVTDIDEASDIF